MIIATLLTPTTLALDFDFNADTNATLKAIGGMWDKPARAWTLPLRNLDKLIARLGGELMADTEVWLAAPVKAQAGANLAPGGATGTPTRYDEMLIANLPAWVRQAEKEQAMKGKRWQR